MLLKEMASNTVPLKNWHFHCDMQFEPLYLFLKKFLSDKNI